MTGDDSSPPPAPPSASATPPAGPGVARRPPLVLFVLLVASLSMALLTAGHARDYISSWSRVRRGKTVLEQRLTLGKRPGWPTAVVPWFDRSFLDFAERLKKTVPADARVLVEPDPRMLVDRSGRARWFMYLNYAVYPLEIYVRKPAWAGGTLVDYSKWIDHHEKIARRRPTLDEQIAVDDRDIDWLVTYHMTRDFARKGAKLYKRNERGEWEPHPLAAHVPASETSSGEEAGQ